MLRINLYQMQIRVQDFGDSGTLKYVLRSIEKIVLGIIKFI